MPMTLTTDLGRDEILKKNIKHDRIQHVHMTCTVCINYYLSDSSLILLQRYHDIVHTHYGKKILLVICRENINSPVCS